MIDTITINKLNRTENNKIKYIIKKPMVTWFANPQHVAENASHMEGFFLLDPIPQSLCKSNVASCVPLKTLAFEIRQTNHCAAIKYYNEKHSQN